MLLLINTIFWSLADKHDAMSAIKEFQGIKYTEDEYVQIAYTCLYKPDGLNILQSDWSL